MRAKQFLLLISVITFVAGCRTAPEKTLYRFEYQEPHMGTMFSLVLYAPDEVKARAVKQAAFARVAALDQMMTDYDPESELMKLCKEPIGKPVRVSDDLFKVLEKSQQVAELSRGAFDVTVGPVVRLWRRSRRTEELPDPELFARARAAVGWKNLRLDSQNKTATLTVPNMQLDLGGIAKGYAADEALALLRTNGITSALVAASGDIAVSDPPPGQPGWRVGIGAPGVKSGDSIVRMLLLKNAAASTSGDTEQFVVIGGKRYSHIVDPRTGMGLEEQPQVTIIARHAVDSDSFSKTVCVLGTKEGLKLVDSQPGMAALVVRDANGKREMIESRRFKSIPTAPQSIPAAQGNSK